MQLVSEWFGASWGAIGMAALSTVVIFVTVLVYTRIVGLRSFAKMSSVDFAATIAIGSAIATASLSRSVPVAVGVAVLGALFLLQWLLSRLRERSDRWSSALDNRPLLLMRHGELLEDNLARAGVAVDDIRSKLREANVLDLRQVRAMVLETTGDVTVLHGDTDGDDVDPWLLEGVVER